MKITQHIVTQLQQAQEDGVDLTTLHFEGDPENGYLANASGDPVPPGTPPPVPPK